VALCDQDDRWHLDRTAALVGRFEADANLLLLHGDAKLVAADGSSLGTTLFQAVGATYSELLSIEQGRGWEALLDRNLVTGATVLLRRSLIDVALPVPAHWLHDEWLGMVAALLGGLALERRQLLDYRQHAGNQVGARAAGVTDLVQRASESRGQWHANKSLRAHELAERAGRLPGQLPAGAREAIQEKDQHQALRASLPAARLARLMPVWREWRSGRYGRFGRGWQGVLRDLLQPD
jgi:hypothetical protein